MLRAGRAPAAYGGPRLGGLSVQRSGVNAPAAPALAGPSLGFRCALPRHSLSAPAAHPALRVRRGTLSNASFHARSRGEHAEEASAGAPITLWVKRMDVAGAQYAAVKGVDVLQTVDDFKARWMAQAKLDVDPSLVTLRLVASGARKPTAEEEQAAVELDPFDTLAAAGITDSCTLLAYVAKSAACSPLPAASVAARELALRETLVAVQEMREYKTALAASFDAELAVPRYVTVPPHPSLQCSTRSRFPLDDGSFTFMRREGSRALADWLLSLLSHNKFASYVHGPQGVGKSHLLYEAGLLLSARSECRVVYEHDCASWAGLANMPIKATLYFLRSIAMAFADDAEVLDLCKQFTASVSLMSDVVAAEDVVCSVFLPQLGDLCKRLHLKVFFMFDQHNSLDPDLRATFPFSLPEARLLRVSQLRGVGMVVISASANNEYYLKVATMEPPLPTRLVTSGFGSDELRVFLQHERMFQQPSLDGDQLLELSVATNRYPLELALLRDAHHALQAHGDAPVTVQHCIHVYTQGDVPLGISGRVKTFALRIAAFDERVRSEPAKLQRLINSVVRMKLELPDSAFPHAVLLNMGICYESDVPLSTSFTEQVLHGGPAQYIRPITPAALQAAVAFYSPDAAYSERESSAVSFIFQSPQSSRPVRGRMLEDYILQQLSAASSFKLSGRKYGATKKPAATAEPLADLHGVQTVRWFGKVPEIDLNVSEDLLLWPSAYNYPGADGMLWLASSKTLLLLQITLSSVSDHKANFWAANEKLRSLWEDKLGASKIRELWLTPYTSAGVSSEHVGQYVCTLAELMESNKSLFPLMKNWEPASEVT